LPNIEIKAVSKNFSGAANSYNYWAEPQKRIAEELVKRIISINPMIHSILDIGCGTGYVIEQILKYGYSNRIMGIDIAEGMISFCRDKWKNSQNISFIHADMAQFNSEISFNTITSSCALQWGIDMQQTFTKILSNLNTNGFLALAILIKGSFYELLESYKKYLNSSLHGIDYRTDLYFKNILIKNNMEILIDETETVYSYHYGNDVLKYFKNIGATFKYNHDYTPLSVKSVNKLIDIYTQDYADSSGRLPISHKVLYLVGRKK